MIPELGKSPRESISYSCQYFWTSLVVQMVNNLPARQETGIPSLDWKDPLEKVMATHANSCLENPHGQRNLAVYSPWDPNVGHD